MAITFEEIFNFTPRGELPAGTYATTIKSTEQGTTANDKAFFQFNLQIQAALDDVDPDELETFGNPVGYIIKARFWFDQDSMKKDHDKIMKFFDACGVGFGSLEDRLKASVGCQVGALTKHKLKDGHIYSEFVRGVQL